ncbi:unnamed protein product [Cercopithifilaria johnstoni]|uniref:Uncharacterized protein n=1 Tax=Cercopithifilaria johnstoni TaxID=2874296 RepID=A0A8J2M6P6_9BILA|nr:unnamed protein product [Cercopithifilaria johnstoni]
MTKKDLLIEWRKQRKVKISPSEIGQRPLHDSTIDADEYQPSTEPALFENESIICCKHGIKCGEYYNQKFETKKKISSLWPIFELFDRKTSNQQQSLLQQKSFYIPKNASKVEIFYRFYLGQKPRSASISLTGIAQNFRLYHEVIP